MPRSIKMSQGDIFILESFSDLFTISMDLRDIWCIKSFRSLIWGYFCFCHCNAAQHSEMFLIGYTEQQQFQLKIKSTFWKHMITFYVYQVIAIWYKEINKNLYENTLWNLLLHYLYPMKYYCFSYAYHFENTKFPIRWEMFQREWSSMQLVFII